jgi:hypothetical protein
MKKRTPSLAIKEMQIKTTLRFYLIPVRIALTSKTPLTTCVCEDVGKKEPLYIAGEKAASETTLEKNLEAS